MLPRFLLADNYEHPEKVFIVHTTKPRCIVECSPQDFNMDQVVHWIDPKPANGKELKDLMAQIEDYYLTEFEILESEDFDDDDE